jgi:hypothetical protein
MHYGTKQAVAFNLISLNTNKSRWSISEDDAKYKEVMG